MVTDWYPVIVSNALLGFNFKSMYENPGALTRMIADCHLQSIVSIVELTYDINTLKNR